MVFVTSDIHGEYDKFIEILKQIQLKDTDTLYVLGDVVDRGPHPIKVLLKLMEMPNALCIVGNHELMALDGLRLLNTKIGKLLEPVLKEALREMRPNSEGLIFYDHVKKSIISTSQVNCLFRRICEKAGLELAGQHALRHTFATRCIEAGVPALVLKNWMGHTDIHITLDTYADVFARMNAGAVEMLDTKMKDIVPVMLTEIEDDEQDLKHELCSAPYKSIGAPHKI